MTPREDIRRIAAEYVIGTLDAAERAAWRGRMAQEPEVAALVAMWERRFFPLHELSAPARPSETLFDLILSRLPVPAVSAPEGLIETDPDETEQAAAEVVELESPREEPVAPIADAVLSDTEEASPENAAAAGQAVEDTTFVREEPVEVAPEHEIAPSTPSGEEAPQREEPPEQVPPPAEPEEVEVRASDSRSAEDAPEFVSPPVEHPPAGQGAPPDGAAFAFERPVPPSEPPAERVERANPWRVASGLLMLALLLGGGAFAYRELHHRTPLPQQEPPREAEVAPVPPPAPPPAEPQPRVPETFAVLGPQPVPAIGFAFDHKAGTVSVLKMAMPPRAGTHYHLWLVTEMDGTHHVAQFDAPGTYPSELLQDVDAAALAGALLVVTEEEEGPPPPAPTGAPVFSGMAVKR